MKIVDGFTFYNEFDLLTYRLNILNDVVDYFILVESTHTHSGKEKILFFNENKHLFEKFNEKIIHVIVDDFPYKYPNINVSNNEQWWNEALQRDAISRGIERITDLEEKDLIIITDLDEIPDPRTLNSIRNGDIIVEMNQLQMDMYYYNLNTRFETKWRNPKIISYKIYKELNQQCNYYRHLQYPLILNGGWHLSYFGDADFIKNKINNFAHQEFNNENYTNLSLIEEKVKNNRSLFDQNCDIPKIEIKDNDYLPVDYDKYLNKYYN